MWFKHSMTIAQQLMPIYNTTVHKNKSAVALNVAMFVPKLKDTNMPQGRGFNGTVNRKRSFWYQGC